MRMLWSAVLVISLLFSQTPSTAQTAGMPTPLEIQIHRLINEVRADKEMHHQDLVPLQLHSVLIDVARAHSKDMLDNNYFDHVDPKGRRPADRVSQAGVEYSSVGENLYYSEGIDETDVAKSAVDGWVKSPGHYANIISPFTYTGIGVAHQGDVYYITQVFVTADPSHMASIGVIYNNNNLETIQTQNTNFQPTLQMKIGIAIIGLILLGVIAGRFNKKYYGRR